MSRQQSVDDRVANVADKMVAPVIEALTVARAAWERLEDWPARIEAEVVGAKRHVSSLWFLQGTNRAAVGPAGDVDAVVEAPLQVVDNGLDIELPKAGKDLLANIGLAVSLSVFEIPDVGRGGHEDTAFPACQTSRPGQVVGKDSA